MNKVPVQDGLAPGKVIGLGELIGAIRRYWILIGAMAICGAVIAALLSLIMRPVYRAGVTLAAVTEAPGGSILSGMASELGGLAAIAGINMTGGGDKNEYVAILKSQHFTTTFIEEGNLLPELFSDMWDEQGSRWDVDEPEAIPSLWDAFTFFDQKVRTVAVDRRSGLITLEIFWYDPVTAAAWANGLVRRANKLIRDKTIDEAKSSLIYLNQQLADTTVLGVEQAIYRLIEEQMKRITYASVREEYAFKVLDPASVPDPEAFVRPNRPLMAFLGLFFGGLLGTLLAVTLILRRDRSASR